MNDNRDTAGAFVAMAAALRRQGEINDRVIDIVTALEKRVTRLEEQQIKHQREHGK